MATRIKIGAPRPAPSFTPLFVAIDKFLPEEGIEATVEHGARESKERALRGELDYVATAVGRGRVLEGTLLKEGTYVTPGNGNLAVLANPPHPNALKVYLNDLLSAEGQLTWSRATGFPSLRRDIPADHVLPIYIMKDGVEYMDAYSDTYAPKAAEVTVFMESVLRR